MKLKQYTPARQCLLRYYLQFYLTIELFFLMVATESTVSKSNGKMKLDTSTFISETSLYTISFCFVSSVEFININFHFHNKKWWSLTLQSRLFCSSFCKYEKIIGY